MSTLFVGVDGGGTHARAVVTDPAGRELARVHGGAGLVRAEAPDAAAAAVAELVAAALRQCGASGADARLCCGLAGAGRAPEQEAVQRALLAAGAAAQVLVTGDADVLMEDAFGAAAGVLLIAGTGSIAWARGHDGRTVRCGGWGALLGDEGSGWHIGLAALRAVLHAHDGRAAPTRLDAPVLAHCAVATPEDLVAWAARAAKADVAALAPAVSAAAAEGDAAARQILDDAILHLARLAITAAARARLGAPRIALAGGVAIALREPLRRAVAARIGEAQFLTTAIDGARGAAALARRVLSP